LIIIIRNILNWSRSVLFLCLDGSFSGIGMFYGIQFLLNKGCGILSAILLDKRSGILNALMLDKLNLTRSVLVTQQHGTFLIVTLAQCFILLSCSILGLGSVVSSIMGCVLSDK
jgi:hypothetical protein